MLRVRRRGDHRRREDGRRRWKREKGKVLGAVRLWLQGPSGWGALTMDPGLPGCSDGVGKPPPPVPGDLGTALTLGLGGRGGGAKAEGGTAGALEAEGEPGEEDEDGEEDGEGLRPLQEDGDSREGGGAGHRHRQVVEALTMDPGLPGRGDGIEKPPPPVPGDLGTALPLGLGGRGGGAKAKGGAAGALKAEGEPSEEDEDGEEDGEGVRPLQKDDDSGEGGGAGCHHRSGRGRGGLDSRAVRSEGNGDEVSGDERSTLKGTLDKQRGGLQQIRVPAVRERRNHRSGIEEKKNGSGGFFQDPLTRHSFSGTILLFNNFY